jgi:hypothetical protein
MKELLLLIALVIFFGSMLFMIKDLNKHLKKS